MLNLSEMDSILCSIMDKLTVYQFSFLVAEQPRWNWRKETKYGLEPITRRHMAQEMFTDMGFQHSVDGCMQVYETLCQTDNTC